MKVKDAMHKGAFWVGPDTPMTKENFDVRRATARDVMTSGIHCCGENDDLEKAAAHMEELKVRRLPVVNQDKRMVGVLSRHDIARARA